MPVGAAIAAAGVGGALISASAAKGAANTQATAATQASQLQYQQAQLAAQLQLGMFNTIRGDLSPYRAFGGASLPGLSRLLGYGMPSTTAPTGSTAVPTTNFSNPAGLTIPGLGTGTNPTTYGANGDYGYDAGTGSMPYADGGFNAGGMIPGAGTPQPQTAGWYGTHPNADWNAFLNDPKNADVLAWAQSGHGDPNTPIEQQSMAQRAAYWYHNAGTLGDPRAKDAPPMLAADPNAGGTPANPQGPSLTPGGDTGSGDIEAFLSSLPGYQFAKEQGLRAVTNSTAARGLGGPSGAYGKGIARFVTGLADSTYQQQLENYFRAAGVGQSAANQTGAYGSTAASGASGSLIGGAGALANGLIGSANANASGQVGVANAITGGINSGVNGYLTSRVLGMYGGGQPTVLSGAPADLQGLY